MLRRLKSLFSFTPAAVNSYAAPNSGVHHVDLCITQAQIDNEEIVALDIPGVASIAVPISSLSKNGYMIQLTGATPDGWAVVAHIRIVSDGEPHNASINVPDTASDSETEF